MEWIKASERLPEKTGWYFVRKGSLKENAHKALHHMDVLKLAAGIEGYWSEVYEWLDESIEPGATSSEIEFAEWIIKEYQPNFAIIKRLKTQ